MQDISWMTMQKPEITRRESGMHKCLEEKEYDTKKILWLSCGIFFDEKIKRMLTTIVVNDRINTS